MNFYRRWGLSFAVILGAALVGGLLLAAPQRAAQGFAYGMQLCARSVLPALFPFFVVCNLLVGNPAAAVLGLPVRPLARLLRFAPGEEAAAADVSVNLAANMLGMGAAATPAGLLAMRKMASAQREPGAASDAMIAFLVVNTTSVQLLPATMIALRAQAGAVNPADIVPATLAATAVSTLCGVLACRVFSRFWR